MSKQASDFKEHWELNVFIKQHISKDSPPKEEKSTPAES